MSSESNFNYFVGALSVLSTLASILVCFNVYMPVPRMKIFDELLMETKDIYSRASVDGLLPPDVFKNAKAQLRRYEHQADDLRSIRYHPTTPLQFFQSFFGGQSARIAELSGTLMELRQELITTSKEQRGRRWDESTPCDVNGSAMNPILPTVAGHDQSENDSGRRSRTSSSSTDSPPDHCANCVCSLVSSASALERVSPEYVRPWNYDSQGLPPDIEACSRSSTLVDYPLPKHSLRRGKSIFARWMRSKRSAEAVSKYSVGKISCKVFDEPQEIHVDSTSVPV